MKQPEFIWFGGESFDKILAEMKSVADDPNRRIEFHLDTKEGEALVFVEPLVQPQEGGGGGTNDSHVCPPQCP